MEQRAPSMLKPLLADLEGRGISSRPVTAMFSSRSSHWIPTPKAFNLLRHLSLFVFSRLLIRDRRGLLQGSERLLNR